MTLVQDLAAPIPQYDEASLAAPRPWGFWATAGLSLVVYGVYAGVSIVLAVVLLVRGEASNPGLALPATTEELPFYGFAVLTALVAAGILGTALLALFAKLRRGWSVRGYLALEPVPWRVLAAWSGVTIGFLLLYHAVALVIKPQNVTGMYLTLYESAAYPWLFWLAIVGAAPLFEEVFFRGFLFRGLAASRLGTWGAIVITALAWAVTHFQYDAMLVAILFALGILFGVARARHGSVTLTIALHMIVNLIAGLEILLLAPTA